MRMFASAAARGCLQEARPGIGNTIGRSMFSALALVSACIADARAETYVGVGAARFDGPGGIDVESRGFEVRGGWQWTEHVAFEAGLIDQRGDVDISIYDPALPDDLVDYRWRALHAGPRFTLPLGDRWEISAGIALAHVSAERELFLVNVEDGHVTGARRDATLRESSFGVLGTLGVAFDVTPRQRISLDYRRIDAALSQRCEGSGPVDCNYVGQDSADGLSLTWSLRFP